MSEPATIVSRGTITIDVETCKGCELCIAACPPHVLTMSDEVNHLGYRYPVLHPGCTGCQACQLICPDFCFEVYKFETPVATPVSAEEAAAHEAVHHREVVRDHD